MIIDYFVKCPHCGFENKMADDVEQKGVRLLWCDVENGGCDRQFAYKAVSKVTVEVKVYLLSPVYPLGDAG